MTAGEGESMPSGVDEAARQQVENQLLDAYAAGRLSDDEFDRRIKLAVGATAQAGLDEAMKDIPEATVATPDPSAAPDPTPATDPGSASSAPASAPSASAPPSAPSAAEPPATGVASRLASTLSPASPTKPATAANPLALDTEAPEFPEYPHRDTAPQASTSPYGHRAPVETPNPYQSPYGPPPANPYAAQAGAELSPYGQQRPGTGRVVMPGEGAAGNNKATGALAHFLGLFTWLVGPGIVYAVSPEGSTAKKEAAKSFNFQAIAMLTLIVAGIATVILPSFIESILFPLLWLGWLLGTVIGGAKAAQGEDWQNPVTKVIKLKILPEK